PYLRMNVATDAIVDPGQCPQIASPKYTGCPQISWNGCTISNPPWCSTTWLYPNISYYYTRR
ncbi:hypothetical protein, partial [Bowdeniella massiliensis]|uniref:hypothetical protein n=1 Tax=Bowdeniella massiliensis TaxID=2932264 RepID=UPI002029376F